MKSVTLKEETTMATPKADTLTDPVSGLKAAMAAAIAENDAGRLRAESSQAPFNTTRLLLIGRREVLDAVQSYLNGDSSKLEALAQP